MQFTLLCTEYILYLPVDLNSHYPVMKIEAHINISSDEMNAISYEPS
jgi:hypothetical protein